MRSASLALVNYLANLSENEPDAALFVVDLYTFRLVNGTVLRWCSGDQKVTIKQGPIVSIVVADPGFNYKVGDTSLISGSNRNAYLQVTTVNPTTGAVVAVALLVPGTDYESWGAAPTFPRGPQPGLGVGLTVNITAAPGSVTYDVLAPGDEHIPAISRSRINSTTGFSVDDLQVKIAATPIDQVNGQPLLTQFVMGDFDGASVLVQRAYMPVYGDTSLGTTTLFYGLIGDVKDIGSASATLTVKALTELLNIDMPRNQYQSGCRFTLFDAGCRLTKSAFAVAGSVGSGATVISIPTGLTQPGPLAPPVAAPTLTQFSQSAVNQLATTFYVVVTYISSLGESAISPQAAFTVGQNKSLRVLSPPGATGVVGYNVYVGTQPGSWQRQTAAALPIGTNWSEPASGTIQGIPPPLISASGYFTLGVITFTSGVNAGLSRFVTNYGVNAQGVPTQGLVTIIDALPIAPAPGDSFSILPGCDKQQSTCELKYFNLINFGGFPFVPVPETVI